MEQVKEEICNSSFKQFSIQEDMLKMTWGHSLSQAIFAVTQLGIADLLENGPKHCDDLAAETNTNGESLYRLMQILVNVDIFSENQSKYFKLTPLSNCLLSNGAHSLRNTILLQANYSCAVWSNLLYTLRGGESAFEHIYGMSLHQHLRETPESAKTFDLAMTELSMKYNAAVMKAYDFSSIEKIVDVGGGEGSILLMLLQRYPALKGILFEQPDVIERAKKVFEDKGIMARCELVSGDFFEKSMPVGADAYLIKNVLNDWDDKRAISILQNCHHAMKGKGKVLVVQRILSDESSLGTRLLDMNRSLMRASTVRLRTEKELAELFKSAGFELTQIVTTESEMSVIQGKPLNY